MLAELQCRVLNQLIVIYSGETTWSQNSNWTEIWLLVTSLRNSAVRALH